MDQPSDSKSAGPARGLTDAALAVQRFIAAQRVQRMYPLNNPNVRASARKLCEVLGRFPAGQPLSLTVERERILCEGQPIQPDQPDVIALARQLYLANLTGLTFEPDATEDEILTLLQGLRDAEEEILHFGEIGGWLRERGVARILVKEASRVAIELALGEGQGSAWDFASLQRLEELEKEVFGSEAGGFRQTLRGVGEGQDAKAARLTGLLARPAEFARLLLEVASQDRPDGTADLDHQFAVTLKLVSELEPMIQNVAPESQVELHGKLAEVMEILERTIRRELVDVGVPPYIRLEPVLALFPGRLRPMSVKEALGLGLGPGLMPVLLGALRRVAAGDERLPAFLAGAEPPAARPYEVRFDAYQPVPLPPAPPVPPKLAPQFFDHRPGGRQHPGEAVLASAIRTANGIVDSIAILRDLLAIEDQPEEYEKLLGALVTRFRLCLASKTLGFAREVLLALDAERQRNAHPELGNPDFLAPAEEAIARCGAPEAMGAFVEALEAAPAGSPEIDQAAELVRMIGPTAIDSLISILAEESSKSTRRKLLDLLVKAGREHVERVAAHGHDQRWFVVRNVVYLLGQFGPAAATRVVALARHPEPRVRREAVRALAQSQDPEVIDLLLELLYDPDDGIVRDVSHRLTALGEPRTATTLNAVLAAPGLADRQAETLQSYARTAAALGDDTTAGLLEGLAATRESRGWLKTAEIRQAFAEAARAIRARAGGTGA